MYDPVCKFLAESFATDFATWLLGTPITLTTLSPSELSLEPIRADTLILLQSDDMVLHVEFQTEPKADIPFRMTDYRLRKYRRFPQKRVHQYVIYLKPSDSPLVRETSFILERTRHEFNVIRLWEQPTDVFLNTPGLLPFAILTQTTDKTETLQQVAEKINQINDTRIQSNISASASILAGLVLNKELIQRVLRSDIMRDSVIYQAIEEEARQKGLKEGLKQGLEQGLEQGRREIAINMLVDGLPIETISRVTGLTIEQVQVLQSNMGENP